MLGDIVYKLVSVLTPEDVRKLKAAEHGELAKALEKGPRPRQLLSPHVGSYDWCFGMGFG